MDATSFELNVSVPRDARFAPTLRELAVHAARYSGCRGADATVFGAVVETVVRACLDGAAGAVPVILRRGDGPLEVLIACDHRFEPQPVTDRHITIGWTRESGRQMCRVARAMPSDT